MEVDQVAAASTTQGATSVANQNLPFVEKYRPASLGDIISHTEIVQTSKYTDTRFIMIANFLCSFNSPQLHRSKKYATLIVLRASRHRQDFLHASHFQGDIWS